DRGLSQERPDRERARGRARPHVQRRRCDRAGDRGRAVHSGQQEDQDLGAAAALGGSDLVARRGRAGRLWAILIAERAQLVSETTVARRHACEALAMARTNRLLVSLLPLTFAIPLAGGGGEGGGVTV